MRLPLLTITTIALTACTPVSTAAQAVPSAQSDGTLFVANKTEGSVSRIRLGDGREERRGPACETPHELSLSPDGRYVAAGCFSGETIEILDTTQLAQVAVIQLAEGARPHGIVWHANGAIYATAEGLDRIYRIAQPLSAAPEITEFPTGQRGSHMLVVSPDANAAWTANLTAGTVTRIDLAAVAAPISVETGAGTEGIALSPDGTALWVSARETDQLLELDPATLEVRQRVATGSFPLRVAVSPDGRYVVTSNLRSGDLTVVDTSGAEEIRTIRVLGSEASQQVTILFSRDGSRIYVAETGLNKIAEIDFATGQILGRLSGGFGGDGLAVGD